MIEKEMAKKTWVSGLRIERPLLGLLVEGGNLRIKFHV
jgi:hypothetical protein